MIIFFDDSCGLCHRAVRFFFNRDPKKKFWFAPLGGETAKKELHVWMKDHSTIDSMVLLEHGEITYYAKAVFRLLWQIGGIWSVIGVLSFLPSWMLFPFNVGYRIVAKCRRAVCQLPDRGAMKKLLGDRLLP